MLVRFWALFKTRMLEYFRDKGALIWSLVFPFILVSGFGVMFAGNESVLYKIGVVGERQQHSFVEARHIQFVNYDDTDKALLKLSQHALDLLVDFSAEQYWVNKDAPKGYIAEKLLLQVEPNYRRQEQSGKQIRYVDWVLPGVLGMNIMFGCLFGVGFAIIRYRKNSVLKRLQATPLSAFEFLLSQVVSRVIIVLFTVTLVFVTTDLIFDFYMIGSYLRLLVVVIVGALSMIAMSLLIAARWESEEFANGLLNFMSWPMLILSGVWFSLEGAPKYMQIMAEFLPLTHMLIAMREVMFNDASLWDLRYHIGVMASMAVVFLVIGSTMFRWHGNAR